MRYVIVTPAYNEEKYVDQTINSVLAQTVQPLLWMIVDDGSTDRTAEIIKHYAASHLWIKYIYRQKQNGQSYYASNVYAIREGYEKIKDIEFKTKNNDEQKMYDYIAILDADIELPSDYYMKIFAYFLQDKKLGIASGHCLDRVRNTLKKGLYDSRSLPKNIMVFRRECYETIGGFIPLRYSGEDTCACFMARMKGWKTWATTDIMVIHNKPMGMGHTKNIYKIRFQQGVGEYFLATPPLFMLLKSIRRCIKEPPFLLGGIARLAGFIYAHFIDQKRQIPDDLVKFIRKEQFKRICNVNRISKN